MRAFIESYMVADPARPTNTRLDTFAKLFEEHGPLSVSSIERSESIELVLGMRSRRGNFRLTVKASEAQPMRVSSLTFAVMEGSHR